MGVRGNCARMSKIPMKTTESSMIEVKSSGTEASISAGEISGLGVGCYVAAGRVVVEDVSSGWLVAGNPARPIRKLGDHND